MTINIDDLSIDELMELNRRIVQRLKFLDTVQSHNDMLKFNPGDKVSFEPPGRGRLLGTLIKYNQKTVSILTEDGQRWNVTPSLVTKLKSVASSAPSLLIENPESSKGE